MDALLPLSLPRTVALVGLMGAGKSAIGKRLATAARPAVRRRRRRDRARRRLHDRRDLREVRRGRLPRRRAPRHFGRLLDEPPHVLSTGGGAYIDPETRGLMRTKALTVWLRAELDVLFDRVTKRGHRPLLRQGDPREILARLMQPTLSDLRRGRHRGRFDGPAGRPHDRAGDRRDARPSAALHEGRRHERH